MREFKIGEIVTVRHVYDGDHDDRDHGVTPVTRRSCRCFGDGDQEAHDDGHIMSVMNCM